MLQKGIIEPSKSDWISEPHLVKKDDGSYRFCIDFRPLNKVTVHDLYPLPQLDDLLDQLGKSHYFTSLDLASGYWQIPLDPRDAHKTAFRTPTGLYQFKQMPFGLSDAGSTFQRMANDKFQDLIQRGVVLVYLDDILVHTATWEQHMQILQEVLSRIQKFNLKLQFKKCRWGSTELKFLGFIISSEGIQMDPSKIFKEAFVMGFLEIDTAIFHPMTEYLKARYIAYQSTLTENPFRQQMQEIKAATSARGYKAKLTSLEPHQQDPK
ncbi:hypothetical protein L7F22_065787 [Adiantum nelumboides]|nr:hypothetical protein [Adiantum nelumboides]